jgi:hypothetical protein
VYIYIYIPCVCVCVCVCVYEHHAEVVLLATDLCVCMCVCVCVCVCVCIPREQDPEEVLLATKLLLAIAQSSILSEICKTKKGRKKDLSATDLLSALLPLLPWSVYGNCTELAEKLSPPLPRTHTRTRARAHTRD